MYYVNYFLNDDFIYKNSWLPQGQNNLPILAKNAIYWKLVGTNKNSEIIVALWTVRNPIQSGDD